jgi:hypothetical protein
VARILGDFEVDVDCPGCGQVLRLSLNVGIADKSSLLSKLVFNTDRAERGIKAHLEQCEGLDG